MNLNDLNRETEDKAVEYLNAVRLDDLEEAVLNRLNRNANTGYVRLHKLEFSSLLYAVRGLHRTRQQLESDNERYQATIVQLEHERKEAVDRVHALEASDHANEKEPF